MTVEVGGQAGQGQDQASGRWCELGRDNRCRRGLCQLVSARLEVKRVLVREVAKKQGFGNTGSVSQLPGGDGVGTVARKQWSDRVKDGRAPLRGGEA